MYKHTFQRHKTRVVQVGNVAIGGDNPIIVQSMTTPDTCNIEATLKEIHRLEEAGCELVRVTVPKLGEVLEKQAADQIPPFAFTDYKMALAALIIPSTRSASTRAILAAWIAFARSRKCKDKGAHAGVNGAWTRVAMKYGFLSAPCG